MKAELAHCIPIYLKFQEYLDGYQDNIVNHNNVDWGKRDIKFSYCHMSPYDTYLLYSVRILSTYRYMNMTLTIFADPMC